MTRRLGRSIHDDPKDHWRAYQPTEVLLPPRRSAMDYESMATTMDSDPLQMSQIEKARNTVVHQSIRFFPDDDEAAVDYAKNVMLMLGIHSSQEQEYVFALSPTPIPHTQD